MSIASVVVVPRETVVSLDTDFSVLSTITDDD